MAALEVLTEILGDNPSGRLYKALVDNKKAVRADMGVQEMHDPGFMIATATLQKDQSIDDARQVMLKTIESFASEPPSKEELERAKTRILKEIELSLTNSEEVGVTLTEWAASGDWRLLFWLRDGIKNVTEKDVARVAKAYLKESNRTLAQFVPTQNPDRAEIPPTPDVAAELKDFKGGETLEEGENFSPTPANVEGRVIRKTLPGGLKLVMLPKKTRGGVVEAQVVLRFGDEKTLQGKAYIASLTGGVLMRGTKNKTRQQIQDETDRLKAQLGVTGGASHAEAGIQTKEAGLDGSLRLAAEVLREPAFPEREFEQFRQQRIAQIEAGKSEPTTLASIELNRHLNPYPTEDPRHVGTPDEQIANLKKVTLDDVKKFHEQFYGASSGEIVVCGQFDPAKIEKLANELFGNWKSAASYVRLSDHYRKVDAIDRKIETPDKQNALFLAGMPLKMTDDDPDFPAMVMADYMFGGSGASRLFKRVRDKEGLSYGIGSQFNAPAKDDGGGFSVYAISAPQNTPKVETSIKDELARTLKEGFNAEELSAAKKAWLDEQLVGRAQDQRLLAELRENERYGRTMKWDEALEAKISALTPDQVNAAFRKYVSPADLSFVKGGDFKKAGSYQNQP
jgi:zinc protease